MQSSPLWGLLVSAIIFGPFIWAIVYGIRHRNSGAPKDEGMLEAKSMTRILKDNNDMRTWRGSRR